MTLPRIHVYVPCYNEEALVPYFLRHYAFAERIFVFDNYSDDRTVELFQADPRVVLERVDTGGVYKERFLMEVKNERWKQSRGSAEWVIVVDTDEFLYHQNLPHFFENVTRGGYDIVKAYGWEMASREFPGDYTRPLIEQVRHGVFRSRACKASLFRPTIEDINYVAGCHWENPTGQHVSMLRSGSLFLLHYKHLGWEYYRDKTFRNARRIDRQEVAQGMHVHVVRPEEILREEFESVLVEQCEVVS